MSSSSCATPKTIERQEVLLQVCNFAKVWREDNSNFTGNSPFSQSRTDALFRKPNFVVDAKAEIDSVHNSDLS